MEYLDMNHQSVAVHVGDRVISNQEHGTLTGTVRRVEGAMCGVEFDVDVPHGHQLGGMLPEGSRRGFYMHPSILTFTGERKPIECVCEFCDARGLNFGFIGNYTICPGCETNNRVDCEDCNINVEHRRTVLIDGRRICLDCYVGHHKPCNSCGKIVKIGEYAVHGRTVCKTCYEEKCFTCDHCGERHFNTHKNEIDGELLCDNCRASQYPMCSICHEAHHVSTTTKMKVMRHVTRNVCASCYEKLEVCSDCGEKVHPEASNTTHDGRTVCHFCVSERYFYCPECSTYHPLSDGYEYALDRYTDTRRVCMSCADSLSSCEDCDTLMMTDAAYTVYVDDEHKFVCAKCRREKYRECAHCGNYGHDYTRDRHGNAYCPTCWEMRSVGLLRAVGANNKRWRAPEGICRYGYKPDPIFFPKVDAENPIYMGVELEVDCDGTLSESELHDIATEVNSILGYSYTKSDSSVENGFEIVTHPAQLEYHTVKKRDAWFKAMEYMRERGLSGHSNGNAGLHVHVSAAPLEYRCNDGVEKLIYLWSKYWDELVLFSRRNTHDSWAMHWARKVDSQVDDYMSSSYAMATLKSVKDAGYRDNQGGARYKAINLLNEHTLEFRLFRSTLIPETFFAALQLIEVMVRAAMQYTFDELREMTWHDLVYHEYSELDSYLDSRRYVDTDVQNWLDTDEDEMIECRVVDDEQEDYPENLSNIIGEISDILNSAA